MNTALSQQDAIVGLSQSSEVSDCGPTAKRSRKVSVIKDPINLTHVHAALQQ